MRTAHLIDEYLGIIRNRIRSRYALLHHACIQGAIESALREAIAVHRGP